jgi:ABC-type transporter Mla MlaB component
VYLSQGEWPAELNPNESRRRLGFGLVVKLLEETNGFARLACELGPDDTLRIELAGAWLLETGAPTFDQVERVFAGQQRFSRALYDTSALGEWDSAVVSFLVQTSRLLRGRGVSEDLSGLPSGIRRLIALALAVPERQGARSAEGREPWLARVGSAGIALAGATVEYLTFIGQCILAFGKLLGRKARYRREDFLLVVQACGAESRDRPGLQRHRSTADHHLQNSPKRQTAALVIAPTRRARAELLRLLPTESDELARQCQIARTLTRRNEP